MAGRCPFYALSTPVPAPCPPPRSLKWPSPSCPPLPSRLPALLLAGSGALPAAALARFAEEFGAKLRAAHEEVAAAREEDRRAEQASGRAIDKVSRGQGAGSRAGQG